MYGEDYNAESFGLEASTVTPTLSDFGAESIMAELAAFGAIIVLLLVIVVIVTVSQWFIFKKANKPGWAAVVPYYDYIIWFEIIGRPTWLVALFLPLAIVSLIPFVGWIISIGFIVVYFLINIDLAKSFGKSTLFGVLMALFPFVLMPILAFGGSQYVGPAVKASEPSKEPEAPVASQGNNQINKKGKLLGLLFLFIDFLYFLSTHSTYNLFKLHGTG